MIIFETPTTIDPLTIKTFGVSVKESDSPIGFFGTGMKYAIAILLRKNQKIHIHTPDSTYHFSKKDVGIRGQMHPMIKMNDELLGFTAEVGKTWELWMAYRELWSNTIDEGGIVWKSGDPDAKIKPDHSYVVVEGEAFEKVYQNRSQYILQNEDSKWALPDLSISRGSTAAFFYRGIRVFKSTIPFYLTYNRTADTDLTEDRTLKYQHLAMQKLGYSLAKSDEQKLITEILTAPVGCWEQSFNWAQFDSKAPEVFAEVANELFKRNALTNISAYKWAVVSRGGLQHKPRDKTEMESKMLEKAFAFCRFLGYKTELYPVIITSDLPHTIFGQADPREAKIYISNRAFQAGTKQLTITLIEETIHLQHNLLDESREMQEYLLHQFVSLGEQLKGEPL
jgi:hypothetical protein